MKNLKSNSSSYYICKIQATITSFNKHKIYLSVHWQWILQNADKDLWVKSILVNLATYGNFSNFYIIWVIFKVDSKWVITLREGKMNKNPCSNLDTSYENCHPQPTISALTGSSLKMKSLEPHSTPTESIFRWFICILKFENTIRYPWIFKTLWDIIQFINEETQVHKDLTQNQ